MTPRRVPPAVETALLPLLGLVAVFAALIPLEPGRLVAPDLVFCLMVAWVIRRPTRLPVWIAPALGLFADVMLMRPIGLGALGLLVATEGFRAHARFFQAAGFFAEWLAATLASAAMLAAMRLVLELSFADGPTLGRLGAAVLVTAAAYPLVVLGLVWCLGIRGPRAAGGRW